jgi:hypothetical protein
MLYMPNEPLRKMKISGLKKNTVLLVIHKPVKFVKSMESLESLGPLHLIDRREIRKQHEQTKYNLQKGKANKRIKFRYSHSHRC